MKQCRLIPSPSVLPLSLNVTPGVRPNNWHFFSRLMPIRAKNQESDLKPVKLSNNPLPHHHPLSGDEFRLCFSFTVVRRAKARPMCYWTVRLLVSVLDRNARLAASQTGGLARASFQREFIHLKTSPCSHPLCRPFHLLMKY